MDSIVEFYKRKKKPASAGRQEGITFRQFHAETDGALYNTWRRDAWRCAHGTEKGYEDVYLAYAAVRSHRDPDSVLVALMDGQPCGLLELDARRAAVSGQGWISFFYVADAFRGKGIGRSMMARAARYYRGKLRRRLALTVASDNENALGFYRHLGFQKCGEQMGALTMLYEMELAVDAI